MINEVTIMGSKETTYHDITITSSGMDIQISPGEYYRANQVLFSDSVGGTITIPSTANMNYEICLMNSGEVHVLQYSNVDDAIKFYEQGGVLDKIAWFTVGANVTSLDNVQINVLKVVDINAN